MRKRFHTKYYQELENVIFHFPMVLFKNCFFVLQHHIFGINVGVCFVCFLLNILRYIRCFKLATVVATTGPSSTHIHTPTAVVVLYVMVPLSAHPVPLQAAVGLAEPWLGCDAEPTELRRRVQ